MWMKGKEIERDEVDRETERERERERDRGRERERERVGVCVGEYMCERKCLREKDSK